MGRVLVTRPLPDRVIAALDGHDVTVRARQDGMTRDEMLDALAGYDAVLPTLGDSFSAGIFAAADAPRARLLANFGVGYNHIDVTAAKAAGMAVTNTPGVLTDCTADLAVTLLLMAARRAGEGERLVRSGTWPGWNPMQLLGTHVTGKTVGIVGMGRIGTAIARRLHFGFAMKVVFFNRSPKSIGFPARQLDSIVAVAQAADFIIVAVPGAADTFHLIGADTFAAMKRTAIFINIARGDVVDEAALIAALETGQIAAAGLDVYEHEPHVPDALAALENAVLLPHLGSAALEVREAMGLMAVDNIIAHFAGEALLTPV